MPISAEIFSLGSGLGVIREASLASKNFPHYEEILHQLRFQNPMKHGIFSTSTGDGWTSGTNSITAPRNLIPLQ